MTKDAILEQLQSVFRDVFDDDELTINRHSSAEDVDRWDSMMHVSPMINVERVFGVRFCIRWGHQFSAWLRTRRAAPAAIDGKRGA